MAIDLWQSAFDTLPDLRFARCEKRLRAFRDGVVVADTTNALLVWEPRRIAPEYAVPPADLLVDLVPVRVGEEPERLPEVLVPGNFTWHTAVGTRLGLDGNGAEVAFGLHDPALDGRVMLDFAAFDWLEEEEPVIGHPHDPFQRIDCLASSRHVVVRLGDAVLAESTRPVALFETHLPPRWYLPREDVRLDLLTASSTHTICPYKGVASYLSSEIDAGADVAWFYPEPLHDAMPVRDLICFWSERCEILVDGVSVAGRMPGV